MNDEHLDALFRSLPEEKASGDFTRRVMTRLGEPGRRPDRRRRLALGLAVAILTAGVTVPLVLLGLERAEKEAIRREIETLRGEHAALKTSLARLKQQAAGRQPVLYVGGNEEVDYVLDLAKYLEAHPDATRIPRFQVEYTGGTL